MIIFNLLPIFPLDGFQILREILTIIYDESYSLDLLKYLNIFMLLVLSITCYIYKSLGLLILTIFLSIKFKDLMKTIKYKKLKSQIYWTNYFKY